MEENKSSDRRGGGRRSSLSMGQSPGNSMSGAINEEGANPPNAPIPESKDSESGEKKRGRRSSTVGALNMGISDDSNSASPDKPAASGGGRRGSTVLGQGGPKRRSSIVVTGLGDPSVSQDTVVMQAEQPIGLINTSGAPKGRRGSVTGEQGKSRRCSSVVVSDLNSVNDDGDEDDATYDGGDEAEDTMGGPDDFDPADIQGRARSGAATDIMKRRGSQWERSMARKKGVGMTAVFKSQVQQATLQVDLLRGYRVDQNSMFQMTTPDIFIVAMFNNEAVYTSPIIRNTFTPNWKDTARFTVSIPEGSALADNKLELFVYDADGGDGSDPNINDSDTGNDGTGNKDGNEKKKTENLNKGGSFGAKLFSALGLGANKGLVRKLIGTALCTNAYLEFLGKTQSLHETMRIEVKQSQQSDDGDEDGNVSKGTLELVGHYIEAVIEHSLDADHAEANELLNMAMGEEEEESESDKSTEYSGEKTDSDDDEEDDFDTIEFSLLAAKNLAKADMMGYALPL